MTLHRTTTAKVTSVVSGFISKNAVKLSQYFGRYYWVPIFAEELKKMPNILNKLTGVRNEDDILRIIETKMKI